MNSSKPTEAKSINTNMKNLYVKPESLTLDYLPESFLCAASNLDGTLEDYFEDDESNFFGV